MELGGQEEDIGISMPIVSYAPPIIHEASKLKLLGGNGAATTGPGPVPDVSSEDNKPNNSGSSDQQMVVKKAVRYRECLKNHAASIGGHAIDGCGDFLPSGEEGTLEALKCAACNCHRNFHRREVEGEGTTISSSPCYFCFKKEGGYPRKIGGGARPGLPSPAPAPAPLALPSISTRAIAPGFDNHEGGSTTPNPLHHHHHALAMVPGGSSSAPPMMMKKRFRTKFSQEQKEKMCSFAEKLGWRIQKHDESAVQQFCMELGIKRHVLKVWMHNNKHTLGKKL